jgi:hypothetical protein
LLPFFEHAQVTGRNPSADVLELFVEVKQHVLAERAMRKSDLRQFAIQIVLDSAGIQLVNIADESNNLLSQPAQRLLVCLPIFLCGNSLGDGHQDEDVFARLIDFGLRPEDQSVVNRILFLDEKVQLNEIEDDSAKILHTDEVGQPDPTVPCRFGNSGSHSAIAV